MREATKEELQRLNDNIDRISKDTGVNFYGTQNTITERLNKFIDYLDRTIDSEMDKDPLSQGDQIRKCSYCLALERCKTSLINILNGKEFDYSEET